MGVLAIVTGTLLVWTIYPPWWQMAVYFWYSIVSASFLRLPHEPAVIYAGSVYQPWIVAPVGGIASLAGCAIDYFLVRKAFQIKKVGSIRKSSLYRVAARCFSWKPWATIVVFSFGPLLPYDAIRILAPATSYPLGRYLTANFVGRVSRYYLLALGGAWLALPPTYVIAPAVLATLIPLVILLWSRRNQCQEDGEDATQSVVAQAGTRASAVLSLRSIFTGRYLFSLLKAQAHARGSA